MQNIIIDKPYQFIPPRHGGFWRLLFGMLIPRYLRKTYGVRKIEFRGVELLQQSVALGHAVLITPNHCRPSDPFVVALLSKTVGKPFYIMASWHLFMQNAFMRWLLPRLHVFSVYREGLDTASVKEAIHLLKDARGPLVVFAEGIVTRTNDRLGYLIEGPAFIARSAASKRAKENAGKVVVHPIAIRYFFEGNVEQAILPVLDEIEARLTWKSQRLRPVRERIAAIGGALLSLKEIEFLGEAQQGTTAERIGRLIDTILVPLENEFQVKRGERDIPARVRALRGALLPDMVEGTISEEEREKRWKHMADLYFAQQLSLYPPGYLESNATPERFLETVERFEEDLTDTTRVHGPLRVVVEVGAAIEVPAERDKSADRDPLMESVRRELEKMLDRVSAARGGA